MRALLAVVLLAGIASTGNAQADASTLADAVDCAGHKGQSTICVFNNTSKPIVGLHCGSYEVPITTWTHIIPPNSVAAAIDLGGSPRTCRNEGLTAAFKSGKPLSAKIDGPNVTESTSATFE